MKIYVENLHDSIDDKKLSETFSPYGEVQSVEIVKDVFTGASRGFAYVEMEDEAAKKAIVALDQTTLNDLKLTIKESPVIAERQGSYKVGSGAINVYRFKKN